MILAIDMGNTNIVLGGIDEKQTYFIERVTTDQGRTDTEYAIHFKNILEMHHIQLSDIEGAILSSVVPPLNTTILNAVEKAVGIRPLLVGSGMKTGMNILMDNPKSVGSDMIVDVVAAIHEHPLPLVVIDMGTATTLSVADKKGNYIGGGIFTRPGCFLKLLKRKNGPASLHQPGNSGQSHRQEHHRLYESRYCFQQCRHDRRYLRPYGKRTGRNTYCDRNRRSGPFYHPSLQT